MKTFKYLPIGLFTAYIDVVNKDEAEDYDSEDLRLFEGVRVVIRLPDALRMIGEDELRQLIDRTEDDTFQWSPRGTAISWWLDDGDVEDEEFDWTTSNMLSANSAPVCLQARTRRRCLKRLPIKPILKSLGFGLRILKHGKMMTFQKEIDTVMTFVDVIIDADTANADIDPDDQFQEGVRVFIRLPPGWANTPEADLRRLLGKEQDDTFHYDGKSYVAWYVKPSRQSRELYDLSKVEQELTRAVALLLKDAAEDPT